MNEYELANGSGGAKQVLGECGVQECIVIVLT